MAPRPASRQAVFRLFFADVVDRMPDLTHLNMKINYAISKVENEVAEPLHGLKKLKKLTGPRYSVTANLMKTLSGLEFLGCIEFQYSDDQGLGDSEDVTEFRPTVEEGAFPSLWDLSWAVSYRDFTRFVNAPFAPTNFYLDSQLFEAPEDVKVMLGSLSENCQLLETPALLPRVDVPNGILRFDQPMNSASPLTRSSPC